MDALAKDDVVAVATFDELAVDIEGTFFRLDTLARNVLDCCQIQILLRIGLRTFLLAVEEHTDGVLHIHQLLGTWLKHEAAHRPLGIELVVHELVPFEHLSLSHRSARQQQHRCKQ